MTALAVAVSILPILSILLEALPSRPTGFLPPRIRASGTRQQKGTA